MLRFEYMPSDFHPLFLFLGEGPDLAALAKLLRRFAEEPLSRISHMVSNVQIQGARPEIGEASELDVTSRFLVYQNRVEYETYIFVGRRNDTLRLSEKGWKIARREILLEQNILLAKNLTTFF